MTHVNALNDTNCGEIHYRVIPHAILYKIIES